jgi:hypothetical protein
MVSEFLKEFSIKITTFYDKTTEKYAAIYHEDGINMTFRNLNIIYHTKCCHIPEDRKLNNMQVPKLTSVSV